MEYTTTSRVSHNRKDLAGQKFGYVTVVRFLGLVDDKYSTWLVRCVCGNEIEVIRERLNKTVNCGCQTERLFSERSRTHGMSKSGLYKVWHAMKSRCENPNTTHYEDYGGRGISVCERWHKFELFIEDMGMPLAGMTIERKDNNGNYEPSNCRWATRKEQQRNRRVNHNLTVNGVTLCLRGWAEHTGIPYMTISGRLKRGWSSEDAVTLPVKTQNRNRRSHAVVQ